MEKQQIRSITLDKKTLIACIAGVLVFLTYIYGDLQLTQRSGYALWDAIPAVGLRGYYPFLRDSRFTSAYNFTVYLIFAIWNYPCWIFEKLTDLQAQDYVFWLLYGKLLVLGGYLLSVRLMRDIFRLFYEKDEKKACAFTEKEALKYMALSLPMLWFSVFTGNYDILEIVFILAGIKALMEEREWRFLLFFAIGASMKSYSLFVFVPVLLLKEKRILYILRDCVLAVSVLLAEELFFGKEQYLADVSRSATAGEWAVKSILRGGVFTQFGGLGNASMCLCLYCALCAYAYLQIRKDNYHFFRKIIYVSMLAYMIMFSTIHFNVYMIIFMAPFLSLMVVTAGRERVWAYAVLEAVVLYLMLIVGMMRAHWVVGSFENYHGLNAFFSAVFGIQAGQPVTIGELFMMFNESGALSLLINSFTIVIMCIIVFVFYPGERMQALFLPESPCYDGAFCVKLRNLVNICLFFLPTVLYIVLVLTGNG